MTDRPQAVDIDDPSSWPAQFAKRVYELANDHQGSTDEIGDLQIDQHEEELVGELFGCPLRAYHCTRLLDHEEQEIRDGVCASTASCWYVTGSMRLSDAVISTRTSTLSYSPARRLASIASVPSA